MTSPFATGEFSLDLVRGDDTTIVIDFVQDDGVTPIDITGRTYRSQIRLKRGSTGAPDAQFTCTVTNAAAGELTLFLSKTDLAALTEDCYWADLEETAGGTVTTVLLPGKVHVIQDVSH